MASKNILVIAVLVMLLVGFVAADNQDRKRDGTGNQDRDRKRDGSCLKGGTCTGNKNGGNPGGNRGNGGGRKNQGKKGTGTCTKSGTGTCNGSGTGRNAAVASVDASANAVPAADVGVQACDGSKQAGKLMKGLTRSGFAKFAGALQQTGLSNELADVMCNGGVTLLAIPDDAMGGLPAAVRGDRVMLREQLLLHVVKGARPYAQMQARSRSYKFACAAGAGSGRLVKQSQGNAPLSVRVGRGWGQAAVVTRPNAFQCTGGAVQGVNRALGMGRMGRPGRRVPLGQCLRNASDDDD
ncbi:hypothetical protein CLOM_g16835 [Closterium sp. NIES-68]|nr:hypothetical protein CLOM_g16835 [Closterium sp. NIES-68]GJP75635.1 hypothetical protein CLOP_g6063 [Closterium sp. NIES-67]